MIIFKNLFARHKTLSESTPTMGARERLFYFFLLSLFTALTVRYFVWWLNPEHLPTNWYSTESFYRVLDYVLFTILTIILFFGSFMRLGNLTTIFFMKKPKFREAKNGLKVAFITCYVPGKEPISMLENTLKAMRNADYKHDTWVLDEGNNQKVRDLCKKLNVLHYTRHSLDGFNQISGPFKAKTKAGNLNSWRCEFEQFYDIVAQLDMDHVPKKSYLERILGQFDNPKVGFVGSPQVYKNTDNWIARGASEQTHFFYGPLQQGFYGAHMPSLTGTSHTYRVSAMKDIGGYSPSIAEDYLTGMHFYSKGWKGVYIPEVLAEGDGPTTWKDYFNQQMRWSYGLFEILFKHSHKHFFKLTLKQKFNIAFSQMFYFTGIAYFLGFLLTAIYLIFGINPANVDVQNWVRYFIPPAFVSLVIGFYLHRYYINPKKEPVLGFYGILVGQAASIIYTLAFAKMLFGRKLVYKVTGKGVSNSNVESLSTFYPHLYILFISAIALEVSYILNNNSSVMRFWGFACVITMTAVILSTRVSKMNKNLPSFSFNFRRLALPMLFVLLLSASVVGGISLYNSVYARYEALNNVNLISPVAETSIVSSSTGSAIYPTIAVNGSSYASLARYAVSKYASEEGILLSKGQENYASYNLAIMYAENPLQPGNIVTFERDDVAKTVKQAFGVQNPDSYL